MKKDLTDILVDKDIPLFSISATAEMLGISVHTLRMYERAGLIIPFQKESKQRLYSHADLERVRCIRKAINEDKLGIAGIQRIHALIPCWEIVSCTQKDRGHCEAYRNHIRACWTFKHAENSCGTKNCRLCTVYKESTDCATIKNRIIEISVKHAATF